MNEEELRALVSVANTLRGMTMDRRIPEDAREVLGRQAAAIDTAVEPHLED